MIVDFEGRILAQAETGGGERIVIAPVDIHALRQERQRRYGHHMLAHLRTKAYGYLQKPGLGAPSKHPISVDETRKRIDENR